MGITDTTIWLAVIFVADIVSMLAYDRYKSWKKYRIKNCKCDLCEKPRKTKETPDGKYWICRACMKLYVTENKGE